MGGICECSDERPSNAEEVESLATPKALQRVENARQLAQKEEELKAAARRLQPSLLRIPPGDTALKVLICGDSAVGKVRTQLSR